MKYRNASDIFPDDLLREIQKYASGELLYIPKETARGDWGENSGAKDFYASRNEEIRKKHEDGVSVRDLAREYSLSEESIRRIIYR